MIKKLRTLWQFMSGQHAEAIVVNQVVEQVTLEAISETLDCIRQLQKQQLDLLSRLKKQPESSFDEHGFYQGGHR